MLINLLLELCSIIHTICGFQLPFIIIHLSFVSMQQLLLTNLVAGTSP